MIDNQKTSFLVILDKPMFTIFQNIQDWKMDWKQKASLEEKI